MTYRSVVGALDRLGRLASDAREHGQQAAGGPGEGGGGGRVSTQGAARAEGPLEGA